MIYAAIGMIISLLVGIYGGYHFGVRAVAAGLARAGVTAQDIIELIQSKRS